MTGRKLALSLLLSTAWACAWAQPAATGKPKCRPAITAADYGRLDEAAKRKYELLDEGSDQGKYKPRYLEPVTQGECAGQYANPCAKLINGKPVDKEACSLLKSVAKAKKLKAVKASDPVAGLAPSKAKKLQKIKTGPDAGKMKPKYFERIKSGESQGLWGSPCAHSSRSTESVDSESCADIQDLVNSVD